MKSSIEEQKKIIENLYHIVKASCPDGVQHAKCRFEYEKFDDGSSCIGQEFYFTKDNIEVSETLERELRRPVKGLVKELYNSMAAHTGGSWDAFTLFINVDGSVTTKFDYA